MREIFAAAAGLAAASIVPAAALSVIWPLDGDLSARSVAGTFLVLYLYSASAVVVLGLPAFFLLRPFRPGNWWSVTAVGVLLGILAAIVMRLPSHPNLPDFLTMGPLGGASALVFWLIWKRGIGPKNDHDGAKS